MLPLFPLLELFLENIYLSSQHMYIYIINVWHILQDHINLEWHYGTLLDGVIFLNSLTSHCQSCDASLLIQMLQRKDEFREGIPFFILNISLSLKNWKKTFNMGEGDLRKISLGIWIEARPKKALRNISYLSISISISIYIWLQGIYIAEFSELSVCD